MITPLPSSRARSSETILALTEALRQPYPAATASAHSATWAQRVWRRHIEFEGTRPKAVFDAAAGGLVAFLYEDAAGPPVAGARLRLPAISPQGLKFCRAIAKVFNQDVLRAPRPREDAEFWQTLQATQFQRAVARYTSFEPAHASDWITAAESVLSTRYEGKSPQLLVLFAWKAKETEAALKRTVIAFNKPVPVRRLFLEEKWIRTAIDGHRTALMVSQRDAGKIFGIVSVPTQVRDETTFRYAPHASLIGLQAALQSRDLALVASPHGDIYLLYGDGVVFQRSQGRWRFCDYNAIHETMRRVLLNDGVAEALLRAALDVSFERKGALFVVPDPGVDVSTLVPDARDPRRPNAMLRGIAKRLRLTEWEEREVLVAAASADGAVLLDREGKVLDVACMIGRVPGRKGWNRFGLLSSGSRSQAAWRASQVGLAVKVSADGPVTILYHGEVLATL